MIVTIFALLTVGFIVFMIFIIGVDSFIEGMDYFSGFYLILLGIIVILFVFYQLRRKAVSNF